MDKRSNSESNISLDSLENNFDENTKQKLDSPSDINVDTILVPFYEKDVLIKVHKDQKKKTHHEHRSRKDTCSTNISFLVNRDVKKTKASSYLEKFRKQFIPHNIKKKPIEQEIRSLSPEFGDTERESFGEEYNNPVTEFYETEAYNEMFYDKILNDELENYIEHSFDASLNLDDGGIQSGDDNNLKSISEVSPPHRRVRRGTVQPIQNMKLGGLGPDMEKIKPRLERARSLQRYSEKVRMENRLKIYKKSLEIELEKKAKRGGSATPLYASKNYTKNDHIASYLVNNSTDEKITKNLKTKPKLAKTNNENHQINEEIKKHGDGKQNSQKQELKTSKKQCVSNFTKRVKKAQDEKNSKVTKSVRSSAKTKGINTDKDRSENTVPPIQISFSVNIGGGRPSSALRTLEEKHRMYQEQVKSFAFERNNCN